MKHPPFSQRTRWNLQENEHARHLAEARAAARPLIDLTESNPTRSGLAPDARLLALLANPEALAYEPLPFGHPRARAAVAAVYGVDPSRVIVTASTSEAYAWLFKLLCDRGDRVLVPTPSYPLFEYLATLEDVTLAPYPLLREEGFRLDLAAIERALEADERTRAILVVHPNNPTGSFVRRDDARALESIAARHGLALIVDEVFADYAHDTLPSDRLPSFVGTREALTFVLSGLSKVAALPQLKLGWILAQGPDAIVRDALARLEIVADTYLSVATPVQLALEGILAARRDVQSKIRARTARNLQALDRALGDRASALVRRLPVDGGWYAILEVPRTHTEDEWIETLLRDDDVIVQPGWFFDLDREGFLVISLLPEEHAFAEAVRRIVARIGT